MKVGLPWIRLLRTLATTPHALRKVPADEVELFGSCDGFVPSAGDVSATKDNSAVAKSRKRRRPLQHYVIMILAGVQQ